jgi:hypothetical protein
VRPLLSTLRQTKRLPRPSTSATATASSFRRGTITFHPPLSSQSSATPKRPASASSFSCAGASSLISLRVSPSSKASQPSTLGQRAYSRPPCGAYRSSVAVAWCLPTVSTNGRSWMRRPNSPTPSPSPTASPLPSPACGMCGRSLMVAGFGVSASSLPTRTN